MAEEKGVWRTISGRRVFIREGQSLNDAMRASGKFKGNLADHKRSKKEMVENGKVRNKAIQKEYDKAKAKNGHRYPASEEELWGFARHNAYNEIAENTIPELKNKGTGKMYRELHYETGWPYKKLIAGMKEAQKNGTEREFITKAAGSGPLSGEGRIDKFMQRHGIGQKKEEGFSVFNGKEDFYKKNKEYYDQYPEDLDKDYKMFLYNNFGIESDVTEAFRKQDKAAAQAAANVAKQKEFEHKETKSWQDKLREQYDFNDTEITMLANGQKLLARKGTMDEYGWKEKPAVWLTKNKMGGFEGNESYKKEDIESATKTYRNGDFVKVKKEYLADYEDPNDLYYVIEDRDNGILVSNFTQNQDRWNDPSKGFIGQNEWPRYMFEDAHDSIAELNERIKNSKSEIKYENGRTEKTYTGPKLKYYSETTLADKELVRDMLSEMRRYERNWSGMTKQEKQNISPNGIKELRARIKELETVIWPARKK